MPDCSIRDGSYIGMLEFTTKSGFPRLKWDNPARSWTRASVLPFNRGSKGVPSDAHSGMHSLLPAWCTKSPLMDRLVGRYKTYYNQLVVSGRKSKDTYCRIVSVNENVQLSIRKPPAVLIWEVIVKYLWEITHRLSGYLIANTSIPSLAGADLLLLSSGMTLEKHQGRSDQTAEIVRKCDLHPRQ